MTGCGRQQVDDSTPIDIDAGRRIYEDGLLPNDEPMTAIVAGDVPILGTQFSCESCHGRSGMGTGENEFIVPPVAGPFLFNASPQPPRPAYTTETLGAVLRAGVTPAGRQLRVELMPRYEIDDAALDALTAYLGSLSADNSPGVDDTQIRFAIAIGGDVDPATRQAVVATIRQFFDEKNRQTRNDSERWDRGYSPESRLPTVFRELTLDEWILSGPSDTWGSQLDSYYQKSPVFAMVGGLADGPWEPVGRFCQQQGIPCLYPSTDRPWIDPENYYTLFFSRGLALEADLIARQLASSPPSRVVQVYCDEDGEWAAARLRGRLAKNVSSMDDIRFDCGAKLPTTAMHAGEDGGSATVFWVDGAFLPDIAAAGLSGQVYLSSTFMGDDPASGLADLRGEAYLVHSFFLPGQLDAAQRRFTAWAKSRGIEIVAPRAQAEAFYASLIIGDMLKGMGRFYIRDYLLDMLEHAQGLMRWVPYHPHASIGPRQRFLTKGGYVLPINDGVVDTENAEWLLP